MGGLISMGFDVDISVKQSKLIYGGVYTYPYMNGANAPR